MLYNLFFYRRRTKISSAIEDCSLIIVTHNHRQHIERCLSSIYEMSPEIIIVDNNSTDGTVEFIKQKYPEIKVIENHENLGYGTSVNIGVNYSDKKYLVISNPDIWVEDNFVLELVKPLLDDKDLITTPKTLTYDGSQINTCGNILHFTGLTFTRGLGAEKEDFNQASFVPGLSGVCFAICRDLFLEIGGFDESIFLYMEDAELSWNINSRGLKILYVPSSIVYHDYVFKVPAEKIYHLELGRYTILNSYFTWKEYLLFLPSLMVAEMLTWGYSLLRSYSGVKFKTRALKDGLRGDVKKKDFDTGNLIQRFEWSIPEGQIQYKVFDKFIRRIGNFIFFINYKTILAMGNMKKSHTLPETEISEEIQSK